MICNTDSAFMAVFHRFAFSIVHWGYEKKWNVKFTVTVFWVDRFSHKVERMTILYFIYVHSPSVCLPVNVFVNLSFITV